MTILCARSLSKRDLFRLPDPFVRVTVDPVSPNQDSFVVSQQNHCTETARNTLDPKWNAHFDLLLKPNDAVTISVWNEKSSKSNPGKKNGSTSSPGFLGCVRLLSNAVERLKDTGYQRLDLVSDSNNPLPVKGQIVISLLSRDGQQGPGKHLVYLQGNNREQGRPRLIESPGATVSNNRLGQLSGANCCIKIRSDWTTYRLLCNKVYSYTVVYIIFPLKAVLRRFYFKSRVKSCAPYVIQQ